MEKSKENAVKKILIVEDEVQLGFILAQTLELNDFAAIAVEDVKTAIQYLEKDTFCCIVSDFYLPEESGEVLFDFVREKDIELPFVFMTGSPDLEFAVKFLKEGGAEYISKPFNLNDFVDKVKGAIERFEKRKKQEQYFGSLEKKLSERIKEITIYRDIFNSAIDGFFIMGMNHIIVKANKSLSKITGYDPEHILDDLKKILVPVKEQEVPFRHGIRELNRTGFWQGEVKLYKENGETYDALVTLSKIVDEKNETFAFSGSVKDISEMKEMERNVLNSLQKANKAQEAIIFGLAKLAESRDPDTGMHLERIRHYCQLLAEKLMEIPEYQDVVDRNFIDALYITAPLHDIGKVAIPDNILLKEGKLTEEEFELMKIHTVKGAETLRAIADEFGGIEYLQIGIDIAMGHHEKWDGSGYPNGLKGEEIPLAARILAIADVYDALTSERIYKKAYTHEDSIRYMLEERGKHFDPKLLDTFLKCERESLRIQEKFAT